VNPLLTIDQAAELVGVPKKTLYQWRLTGYGPPALRVGRHLKYRAEDIESWAASQVTLGSRGPRPA
jgi:excisionase family DNA binding protein